jgi:hypothetical protein
VWLFGEYVFGASYHNNMLIVLAGEMENKMRKMEYGQMIRTLNASMKARRN